jgi:signal transduction histidine kinase
VGVAFERMLRDFDELAPVPSGTAPTVVKALRAFAVGMLCLVVVSAATTDPRPAVQGRGLLTTLALVTVLGALAWTMPRRRLAFGRRAIGLSMLAAGSVGLTALQPGGAAVVGVYAVVVVAAMRLRLRGALLITSATLAAEVAVLALTADKPGDQIFGLLTSIVPWLLVMRLVRNLRDGRARAEQLVDELRESREAEAQAAVLAERGRVARDMHDVLAHSLSALALQLEGARLLAQDRDTDPEVVQSLERAHHLAAAGLEDARRTIAALHGDELPGPDGLQGLAEAFRQTSGAGCEVTTEGEPRPLASEVRLALYRTAQEALTNVRRHAAAERVEVRLDYQGDGVTLTVADHGPGAPVGVGAGLGAVGSGYGLTGMRERAELLGGSLEAGPADDGFRVRLWLPA